MEKLMNGLEKALLPVAQKLSANKYLNAIKDGFITIMPLLIVGALIIVVNAVVLDWGDNSLWYNLGIKLEPETVEAIGKFKIFGGFAWQGTLAIIALLASFTVAYSYANSAGLDGLASGVISAGAFFTVQTNIGIGNMGTVNLISALIIALVSASIYEALIKNNVTIKMPDTVPPGVAKAFTALIPAFVIIGLFSILAGTLQWVWETDVATIINNSISDPLKKLSAEGPIIAYIYATLSNILFFFGIHGPNVLAFLDGPILTANSIVNSDALGQGVEPMLIYTKGLLDSFVALGGAGATIGLIIAIFIGSKSEADREVAKFSVAPALFNINEPLLFGLPIVLNPVYFIPFVLVPPILLTTAIIQVNLFYEIGLLVHRGAGVIPWVSPPGVGAFLAYQSFGAIIIAVVQVLLSTIIYLPFVRVSNKMNNNK